MTTLTNTNTTLCDKGHTPHNEAISVVYGFGVDVEYTFCEVCENNMERDYFYDDYDRSHYDKIELGENKNDTSKTNNN